MERFTTTVFVVFFYFPLVPTGTYLAERERGFFANPITFLEKLPLDWEQVLKVWVVAAGSLLALIWVFKRCRAYSIDLESLLSRDRGISFSSFNQQRNRGRLLRVERSEEAPFARRRRARG